jgi:hypothetical protein
MVRACSNSNATKIFVALRQSGTSAGSWHALSMAAHVGGASDASPPIEGLIKVRAITNFLVLTPDQSQWGGLVRQATSVATALVAKYTALGYEVSEGVRANVYIHPPTHLPTHSTPHPLSLLVHL